MKALLIASEKLPVPPIRGGATQTYIAAIAPLLGQYHDVTVLGIADPNLPAHEVVERVRYERVLGGQFDLYAQGVGRFVKQHPFDVIHIFNRPRLVLPVRKAAPGAKLILSLHNDMFAPGKIEPDEAERAIAEVERIITVSDYVGWNMCQVYPQAKKKVRTIYAGVDLARFRPCDSPEARQVRERLRREHGLDGKRVILFVGRLSPKKGADLLIQAMPLLTPRHPDIALVLVGSKWYGEDQMSDYVAYVRSLAARSPVPVVTTGFVPQDQVHEWFWAGDLFVCSSQWEEPLARVHYEAMAAGLPIVSTARGGNPEIIRGNGLVVNEPEEPAAFAEALSRLLSDPALCRQMGRRGREMAQQHFSWRRVATEIIQTWSEAREA